MRRLLISAVSVPVFALAACGGGEADPQVQEPDSAPATSVETQDLAETTTEDMAQTTTEDMASETAAAPDDSSATSAGGEAMGGEEGQAAADRTEEFLVALVNADPKLCETMLNLQSDAPMAESPGDLKLCRQQLIPTLEKEMKGLMTKEQAGMIDGLEINGAMVKGDIATVTKDNYAGSLGQGFANGFNQDVKLQRIDDEWYVDFQKTFQP